MIPHGIEQESIMALKELLSKDHPRVSNEYTECSRSNTSSPRTLL